MIVSWFERTTVVGEMKPCRHEWAYAEASAWCQKCPLRVRIGAKFLRSPD